MSGISRSENMRRIRSKDTKPEWAVRRLVYALGFRYRLHRKDLPGKPDLTFGKMRKVIFVNGCFWHGHGCKDVDRTPKQNRDYWVGKISRNKERDQQAVAALKAQGWAVLTVWECEIRNRESLAEKLKKFLLERPS